MKRLLLAVCAILMSAYCFADKAVKVKQGSLECLQESSVAAIEFDFSKTTWEVKVDFKTWCGKDYDKRIELMKSGFVTTFNLSSSGMKIALDEAESPKYKILFTVDDLARRPALWGHPGQGKFYVSGKITVVDIATNETVCLLDVDKFGAGIDYTNDDGLMKCFSGLAKAIFKLK